MINVAYLFIVLAVALLSMAIGFRRGITMQIGSLLGFAFGAVAARVVGPEWAASAELAKSASMAPEFRDFTANLICGIATYIIVYFLFSMLTPVLRSAMSVFQVGVFNRMLGAFFCLVKNLLWLSMALNLLLCLSPKSELLRYESANDGNLIAAVMELTPAILGCNGAHDFAHFHQLKEAKSISHNFNLELNVIIEKPDKENFVRRENCIKRQRC